MDSEMTYHKDKKKSTVKVQEISICLYTAQLNSHKKKLDTFLIPVFGKVCLVFKNTKAI